MLTVLCDIPILRQGIVKICMRGADKTLKLGGSILYCETSYLKIHNLSSGAFNQSKCVGGPWFWLNDIV
jgi:hypothetical protein